MLAFTFQASFHLLGYLLFARFAVFSLGYLLYTQLFHCSLRFVRLADAVSYKSNIKILQVFKLIFIFYFSFALFSLICSILAGIVCIHFS